MKRPNKKAIVVSVVLVGIAVFVASGFALRRPILEQWYLWKLGSEIEEDRRLAAEKLGGMKSVKAVPGLIGILREYVTEGQQGGRHYVECLQKIGTPAVPAIVESLREDEDNEIGPSFAALLGEFGPKAEGAIDALIQVLSDENKSPNTRGHSAIALSRIAFLHTETRVIPRAGASNVLSALIQTFEDSENVVVRRATADALGLIGPEARDAVPMLIEALEDGDEGLRRNATRALRGIQGELDSEE